mmetsp:Transcript_21182/g.39398  ORF Transcript_21182/g.39398 Transcript_21182/m.39398 type:complete len:172 (-) Transcript_21182:1768-2283(-)
MLRVGGSIGHVSCRDPNQETAIWRDRCAKEGEDERDKEDDYILVPKLRKRPSPWERKNLRLHTPAVTGPVLSQGGKEKQDDEASVVSSCSSIDSRRSRSSNQSRASRKSQWSLRSFNTADTGFTFHANERLAKFERDLQIEKEKRIQAEEKLDKLVALLEAKDLLASRKNR